MDANSASNTESNESRRRTVNSCVTKQHDVILVNPN